MSFLFTVDALITYGLIALAAFFNAVMDVIKHRWPLSIFARIKPLWFRAWLGGKDFLDIETMDGWHTAKRLMLFCLFLAVARGGYWPGAALKMGESLGQWWPNGLLLFGAAIAMMALVWTLTFNWLYDHGLAKKPSKSNDVPELLHK